MVDGYTIYLMYISFIIKSDPLLAQPAFAADSTAGGAGTLRITHKAFPQSAGLITHIVRRLLGYSQGLLKKFELPV